MIQIKRRALVVGTAASSIAGFGLAQEAYPTKPIKWIVTYPAGGGADWLTRSVTDRLRLAQPVVVDNRPGGGNSIGINVIAKSPADGYTVGTVDMGGLTMLPHLMKGIPYDPLKDLQPISLFVKTVWIFVVNPERVPVSSFTEFLKLAKASPRKYSFGSFGSGSITHVMLELLALRAGVQLLHVPYKGTVPAQQDLISGQIDAMITDYSNFKTFESTGKMKVLAVSTSKRLPQLPAVPTFQESGVPDYDVANWLGVAAPMGTPAPVIQKLQAAVQDVVRSPEIASLYAERAFVPESSTPAQLQQMIRDDYQRWGDVIRSQKISLE